MSAAIFNARPLCSYLKLKPAVSSVIAQRGAWNFYQANKRSGRYYNKEKHPNWIGPIEYFRQVKEGAKIVLQDLPLLKKEMRDHLKMTPMYFDGDIEKVWTFDSPDNMNMWSATSDRDWDEGFSECDFTMNENKKGIFKGYIDTRLPKDGQVKYAGLCAIRSMRPRKAFNRETALDWSLFTHLIIRLRGDGRNYMINLSTPGEYDIFWDDIYQFVLYTRGGPYWQTAKIPFSKFFLSHRGRIQDKQCSIPLSRIAHAGIGVTDTVSGPFRLEIDYIGVQFDANHKEEFAYEMYKTEDALM